MAGEITSSTTSIDQEKFLVAKLLQVAHLKMFAMSVADKQKQPKGTGTQCTFIRYKRMNVPLAPLSEGVKPANSSISLESVTGSMDQWGDVVTITDVAKLTTKHPLVQIATNLLSDNAQRVIDREIQIVMLAGTNVQYGDGTATSRTTITTTMTVKDNALHKMLINLELAGAPPRSGPSNMKEQAKGGPLSGDLRAGGHYVLVCGPELRSDIMRMAAADGLWTAVVQYQNAKAVYNAEVGTYLGFRVVLTNFIPRFRRLGDTTVAAALGANAGGITGLTTANAGNAGNLVSATAYNWKVTRKDLTRGFEEDISITHTTAAGGAGDNEQMSFTFPSTAGYVYNLYFSDAANAGTDATLYRVAENVAASGVATVTTLPTAGTNPPPSNKQSATAVDTVYPLYVIADQWLVWTGLQELKSYVTDEKPDKSDPLGQLSTIGYKFMAKAAIMDQTRGLRGEFASNF